MKNKNSFIISGGINKLNGLIKISGSKNSSLSIIIASILTNKLVILKNVPLIDDIKIIIKILKSLGSKIFFYNSLCYINNNYINKYKINNNVLVSKIRASILLIGPMIIKFKKFYTFIPGGCNFQNRPIDLHIKNIRKFGININILDNSIYCFIHKNKHLKSINIKIERISIGVTLNIIFISVLLKGLTIINNPSLDPEVIETINFLNTIGSKIKIYKKKIFINGVKSLNGGIYNINFDRIELGTFLIASSIFKRSDITFTNIVYNNELNLLINKLKKLGLIIDVKNKYIRIKSLEKRLNSISIYTNRYPGYPTDMQPQITLLNSISIGKSIIRDNIFNNRFLYVNELIKLGAIIKKINNNTILCIGVNKLYGSNIDATDLRSAATLILAGCIAEGKTIINNSNYIYRGYENFIFKLNSLGANIKII